MDAKRHLPFSMRSLEGLPPLTMSQKQRLLMEIFLDETGECEQMLAEIFRSDTSESHFMQHRIMTSVHYNYSRSNSLLRDNYEYIMYKHARVEAYRNEMVHQAETVRQLLEMAGMPSPEKDPRVLTLTVDDMHELLLDNSQAHDLAEELRAVFREGALTDGESFKDRQDEYRARKRLREERGEHKIAGRGARPY